MTAGLFALGVKRLYRFAFGSYVFPESLTYNLVSFRSSVPSAKLPRAHGARVPRGFLAERRIEVRGLLKRNLQTGLTLQEQLDDLRAALITDTPKTLYLPNDRHLREVQKDDNGQDRYENTWPERIVDVAVDLITGDPFMYSDTESEDLSNAVDETPEYVTVDNDAGNAPAMPEMRLTVNGGGGASGDIPATSIAGATEFSVTSGANVWNYGCLNGDVMTVYVDQYGDFCERKVASGTPVAKEPGIGDGSAITGYPDADNIGTNGQILPTSNPPGYGILRSVDSRNGQVSTEAAIEGRRELLTLGTGTVCASWGVRGAHADLVAPGSKYLVATDGTVNSFSVSGANAGGAVSATSVVMYVDQSFFADLLEVKHIISFQNAETLLEKTRVKVRVEMRNPTGSTLTGIKYVFGIDPNPGVTSGDTGNYFFTPADIAAIAVTGDVSNNFLSLGGYTQGTLVGYTSETRELVLIQNADSIIAGGIPHLILGSGTNAEYYFGGVLDDTTTNFQTDTAFRNGTVGAIGDYALLLRSPTFSIAAGATQVFEYYLFTRIDLTGGDVDLAATVTNQTTGEEFTLTGTVPDGTEIVVNSLEETVTIDDADRTDLFDGLFPSLALGNNIIRVIEPSEAITNLDVVWRSRWY